MTADLIRFAEPAKAIYRRGHEIVNSEHSSFSLMRVKSVKNRPFYSCPAIFQTLVNGIFSCKIKKFF